MCGITVPGDLNRPLGLTNKTGGDREILGLTVPPVRTTHTQEGNLPTHRHIVHCSGKTRSHWKEEERRILPNTMMLMISTVFVIHSIFIN